MINNIICFSIGFAFAFIACIRAFNGIKCGELKRCKSECPYFPRDPKCYSDGGEDEQ